MVVAREAVGGPVVPMASIGFGKDKVGEGLGSPILVVVGGYVWGSLCMVVIMAGLLNFESSEKGTRVMSTWHETRQQCHVVKAPSQATACGSHIKKPEL